jgi:hypothetical protein
MDSNEEETQIIQAFCAIEQFAKIFAKNYPLVFKNGVYSTKMYPDIAANFPYEVVIETKVKK